ncbi:putative spermidine/putrescine transport system substrate-binding protein [Palleronia aestuarii]|uniref:Putative spermidine/putrescine transport system substrate-binding protein n=1 Tax=Palleronia aestuarii TaxID=568105 RepID=A0A2W7NNZ5_9RHOB|nr:extracellular solute-binding protein [Palleronia aestuarii]PZX19867.1 putative spermidine/putrescine transport system substrate-binding protein [Palleronia aestuarii]
MTKYHRTPLIGRRNLLKGAAGGAALLAAPSVLRAQSAGTVVVGTWGGDYARLLNKNIEQPFLISNGWEVIQDQAGDPERRAKMLAERRLPRGTTDLQGLNGPNMYQVYELGITQAIDYDQIPNAANLLPSMKYEYGIGHIYSGMVPVYNPDLVEAPTSYADVFDPAFGDQLGFIDIQYQYTIVAAALAAGGGVTDVEPGKELLLKCREAGARIYPTNEAFAQGLETEEISIGIMWKARTVQWQDAGINVESVAPSEGALSYVSGFVIPANAPHPEGAYAYLNAMLEPAAQEAFAEDMGYNPTVTNAEIPEELNQRIGFSQADIEKLNDMDYEFMLENDMDLKNWWDREFKG